MKNYLSLFRVKHCIKNLLIFLPAVTAHELFHLNVLRITMLGFVQFCLLASAVYVINDICDVDNDRLHPTKCKRPLASGAIGIRKAKLLVTILLLAAVIIGVPIFNWKVAIVITCYLATNIAYSLWLKHVAIVDVVILASGYIMRILFSLAITGIPNSKWLFLTILSTSLFLALGKRRGELRNHDGAAARRVLRSYPVLFLDNSMYMAETLVVVFYSLWSFIIIPESNNMIYTVPLLLVILLRYNLCLEQDSDGDPVTTLLGDKTIILLCVVFCFLFVGILYLPI